MLNVRVNGQTVESLRPMTLIGHGFRQSDMAYGVEKATYPIRIFWMCCPTFEGSVHETRKTLHTESTIFFVRKFLTTPSSSPTENTTSFIQLDLNPS